MKFLFTLLTLLLLSTLLLSSQTDGLYYPPQIGDEWSTIDPMSLSFCPSSIDDLYHFLEESDTKSFILLKDGRIVLEKYFGSFTKDSSWVWFSAGKSLTAALVGIAQSAGFLNIQDRTTRYLGTGWTSLPVEQEDSIRIWHQLTMTSGLNEQLFSCTQTECLTYEAPPGTRWIYHNAPYSLLRNVIENASGMDYNFFTNQFLARQIGMEGVWLKSGFNNFYISPARTMARFGLLIQGGGIWDNSVVLKDAQYLEDMVRPSQNLNPSYGYLWWLNGQASFIGPGSPSLFPGMISPDAPDDVFVAAGSRGQFISICPSKGYVVVRQGDTNDLGLAALALHNQIWQLIGRLDCATTSEKAYNIVHQLLISPNPVSDQLSLILKGFTRLGRSQIKIIDTQARVWKSMKMEENANIDLGELPVGVYYLYLQNGTTRIVQKFIKH